jgi:hypothetical protein
VDLKSGQVVPGARLQTAGYAILAAADGVPDIDKAYSIIPQLKLARSFLRYAVHLGANGKPKVVLCEDDTDIAVFTSVVLAGHKWKLKHGIVKGGSEA